MTLTTPADLAPAQGDERTERAEIPTGVRTRALTDRTLPLLAILFGFGALLLAFSFATVHRRSAAELDANWLSMRARYEITHWLEYGYFDSAGLLVRPDANGAPILYRSSTGGVLVPAFVVQKLHHAVTGRPNWPLLALSNQLLSLLASSLVALLGYRLARRTGVPPLQALALGCGVLAAHFSFPDNLMTFWEMSGRVPFLAAACVFLLLEDRRMESDSRHLALALAQAGIVFLAVASEVVTGTMFVLSYGIVSLLLGSSAPSVRRLLLVLALPMLLAIGAHWAQIAWATARHPEMATMGSGFGFRTGLDGSLQYYRDHLDIAYGRGMARSLFGNNALFEWSWLFFAGCAAMLVWLIAALRERVPAIATTAALSLLGTYVLHAAIFSQAVTIHPYYYDVLLYTPLILALLVLLPSLLYATAREGGPAVVLAVFVAVCVCMVQLRKYAVMYPQPAATQVGASERASSGSGSERERPSPT